MYKLPITQNTMLEMAKLWALFISYKEIGYFIWPPKANPARRILQLINSRDIQISAGIKPVQNSLIHLDFKDESPADNDTLFNLLSHELTKICEDKKVAHESSNPLILLETLLNSNYNPVLFVTGLNEVLNRRDFTIIKEIGALHERFNNLSILIHVSTYLDQESRKQLFAKQGSSNNIYYHTIYTAEDSIQFISYIINKWKMNVKQEQKDVILRLFQGRLGLIKNALRILRNNPGLKPEELVHEPSIQERAYSIINALPVDAASIVYKIIKDNYNPKKK